MIRCPYEICKILMEKIIQINNLILRKTAVEVPIDDIRSQRIQTVIKRMEKTLDLRVDGVGLAAPQIGESLRIFVVSRKRSEAESKSKRCSQNERIKDVLVFINPEIITSSKERAKVIEGCLSVEWYFGKTVRHKKMTVRAYDEKGKQFTYGGSGLMAQIFQHEIDHLNGVLFIDHASEIKKLTHNEIAQIEAENNRAS